MKTRDGHVRESGVGGHEKKGTKGEKRTKRRKKSQDERKDPVGGTQMWGRRLISDEGRVERKAREDEIKGKGGNERGHVWRSKSKK